jgi:sugar transferase (PEP-CTERM system associated)
VIRIFRHYIPRSFIVLGLAEFLILISSVYVGVWLRFMDDVHGRAEVEPIATKAVLFALMMLAAMIVVGLYQRNFREGMGGMLLRVAISALLGLPMMSVIFYAFPGTFLGRGAFGLAFAIALVGIILVRIAFFRIVDEETLARRVLVLGAGKRAMAIAGLRRKSDRRGCNIVGYVHVPSELDAGLVIRRDTTLLELAQSLNVDEIIVAVEDRRKNFPVHEILDCRMAGIEVMDIMSFIERQLGRVELKLLHPSWLIFSDGFRYGAMRVIIKRTFDVVASLSVLAVTWPFMVMAAVAILLEGGGRGPIFYHQVRVGENWKLFQVTKFRSMRVDAEADGVARWAQKNDSRITLVGAFLRKSRIDELPQLFNVLRGDMSFVGPRPERPMFVEKLSAQIPFYSERHRVKPGITGWAQISYAYGASEEDAVQKLQYDLYYVKNYSLFLDVLILLQTAEVVLWGRGAR